MRAGHGVLLGCWLSSVLSGCTPLVIGGAVAGGAAVIYDRRGSGTVLNDQAIELKADSALSAYPGLADADQAHINVTSYNGMVLLTGEVTTPELRQQAVAAVQNLDNVRQIYDELAIRPPSFLGDRSNDFAISTNAKAALFRITNLPGFNPLRVKIVTARGTVYLMGLVKPQEAEAVVATVRQLSGVRKVVTLFEYLPDTGTESAPAASSDTAPDGDSGYPPDAGSDYRLDSSTDPT